MVSHVSLVQTKAVPNVLELTKESVQLVRTVISRLRKILAKLAKRKDALHALVLALEHAGLVQLTITSKTGDVFPVIKENPHFQTLRALKHALVNKFRLSDSY